MSGALRLYAYLCDSLVCQAMEGDLVRTCNEHPDIDLHLWNAEWLKRPALAERAGHAATVRRHLELLAAADWDGELPAFVLATPIEHERTHLQAFGGEGWPIFNRFLDARKARKARKADGAST
jgi:hypothetical protein